MTMTQSRAIKPTVGRRLWYFASNYDVSSHIDPLTIADRSQPLDAGIAYVHSDRLINISVTDQNGVIHSRTSVTLYQDGEFLPVDGNYCVWMDYQVQQAAKEAGQTAVASVTSAEIESAIVTKGLTAPRITIEAIEASVVGEYYLTGDEIAQASKAHVKPWPVEPQHQANLGTLTICILLLRNGFMVVGKSAVASPVNFDAKLGREIARKDAVSQIWAPMGFELRSKLQGYQTNSLESGKSADSGRASTIQAEAGLTPVPSVQISTNSPISVTGTVAQESPAQALIEPSTDCHVSDRSETTWVGVDCGSGAGDSGSTSFSE